MSSVESRGGRNAPHPSFHPEVGHHFERGTAKLRAWAASPAEQALAMVRFQALETANYSQASSTDRKAVQAGGLRFRDPLFEDRQGT